MNTTPAILMSDSDYRLMTLHRSWRLRLAVKAISDASGSDLSGRAGLPKDHPIARVLAAEAPRRRTPPEDSCRNGTWRPDANYGPMVG